MDWMTAAGAFRLAAWLRLLAPRPPRPGSIALKQRLAQFPVRELPLERSVTIRWNEYAVPFIEAECDRDLPAAIGFVHAHLRLGQMELFRRVSQGRLSEMVGSAAFAIDHTLRIFDFGKAVPAMLRALPDESRMWLERYVDGVNAVLASGELPHEFRLFALEREPWTVKDVLTLGRGIAFDNTWLVWLRLMRVLDSPRWNALWAKLIASAQAPLPAESEDPYEEAAFAPLRAANNRAGSNAYAVAASRAGKTWIACDPHLGISLPSNWLLLGYRSPSHHAVGLTIPGAPFIVTGRNRWIAWGGTSLHAHASELVDVSDHAQFDEREETIRVRWGKPRKVRVRSTPDGPVLTDSAFYRRGGARLALRWMGHRPSDEVTSVLAVSKARDWASFKAALDTYAVPGLNMVYADANGEIGHALAAWVPKDRAGNDFITRSGAWTDILHSDSLPSWHDPESGVVVSANERPDSEIQVGRFFSSRSRTDRILSLLDAAPVVDRWRLAAIQQDVRSATSQGLARVIVKAARTKPLSPRVSSLVAILETWDGTYDAASQGPALFEALLHRFARAYYPSETLQAYSASWAFRDIILAEIETAPLAAIAPAVHKALSRIRRLPRWGEVHRLRLEHLLAQLPGAKHYRYFDLPSSGGSDTVMKTANSLAAGKHGVRFGANARFISNLNDADENHFVLLGGQDGWFGSVNFSDQVRLWRAGDTLRLPLRPETVQKEFKIVMRLKPAN
jgi:penicillin amidase